MARWTDEEVADLRACGNDFKAFQAKHPDRDYNSWEVKRRRLPGGSAGTTERAARRAAEERALVQVPAAPSYAGPLIAFWDLETTYSSQPRILSGAFADGFGQVTVFHLRDNETRSESNECDSCGLWHTVKYVGCAGSEWIDDLAISTALRDEAEKYQIMVGWNSVLFDEPVLNGRLMVHLERTLDPLTHKDLMYEFSGRKARLGRRSLENISTVFGSPHRKTPLNPRLWDRADHGDAEAYDLIIEHNVADVLVTRDVFAHARPRIRKYIRGG